MVCPRVKNKVNIVVMFFVSATLFLILFYDTHLKNMNNYALANGFGQLTF